MHAEGQGFESPRLHQVFARMTLLEAIDASVIATNRETRRVTEAGGFLVMVTPGLDKPWLHYAIPLGPPYDVGALVAEFGELTPRLEYREARFPEVAGVLEAFGFRLERHDPVMALFAPDLVRPPTSLEAFELGSDEPAMREALAAVREAFGGQGDVTDQDLAEMRDLLHQGIWRMYGARVAGVVAGGASISTRGPLGELAGVGTHSDFRRRGVATAVSLAAVEAFFSGGGQGAWLSAGSPEAEATYAKLGFQRVGSQLNYVLER